jgi:hypothetical protein
MDICDSRVGFRRLEHYYARLNIPRLTRRTRSRDFLAERASDTGDTFLKATNRSLDLTAILAKNNSTAFFEMLDDIRHVWPAATVFTDSGDTAPKAWGRA